MTDFPWDLVALALVLAVNRLGTPATYERPVAFWGIQVVNLVLAAAVAVFGMPGLSTYASVNWLVAGLLVFHVFQNITLRGQARRKREAQAAERARMRKLRALAGEGSPPSEAPPG